MRKYWIDYYMSFGNTYHLYYTTNLEEEKKLPENAERITRRTAEKLAAEENYRRKYDSSFSHYADNLIYPIDFDSKFDSIYDFKKFYIDKYIVEKIS